MLGLAAALQGWFGPCLRGMSFGKGKVVSLAMSAP